MNPKKLTGWLIVLIIWIGLFGFSSGMMNLSVVRNHYQPHIAEYPSLRTAIMVFQILYGAGVAVWVYTAWLLYRRKPGTLATAQSCLMAGAALRLAGSYSIPLLGGLPAQTARELVNGSLPLAFFMLLFTSVWYLYLARSQKVRELYAD